MYEYKFIKYEFPTLPYKQKSFNKSLDEDDYFSYHDIIKDYAKKGWKLNSIVQIPDIYIGDYYPIALELIFERKKI